MKLYKALYNILTNDTDVTDQVNNRIYPIQADRDAHEPYIVHKVVSSEPEYVKDEPSKVDTLDVEMSIYAKDVTTLEDTWNAVRTALEKFTGTKEGIDINQITLDEEEDEWDEDLELYKATFVWNVRVDK